MKARSSTVPVPPLRSNVLVAAMLVAWMPGSSFAREVREQVGFMGIWDRAKPMVERASREMGVPIRFLDPSDDLNDLKVLLILNLDAEALPKLTKRFRLAIKQNPDFKIIPLDHRDGHANLDHAGLLHKDDGISPYWRAGGAVNIRRLLRYVAITYLGMPGDIEPPAVIPDFGFYHPSLKNAPTDLEEFKTAIGFKPGAPVATLLIQSSFWITSDTKVIDAEIRALERQGMNVVTIFDDTGIRTRKVLQTLHPDIIVEDRHGSLWTGGGSKTLLEGVDAPYLRPISMLASTVDEWLRNPRGLSRRDTSLFMTLQEPKGTIEPLVVGGLKVDIQGFRLHEPIPERIERFARRAASWVNLRRKPNREKRIAIIYYNKSLGKGDLMRGSPTGAFLDAPQSLMRFLPRLQKRGYDVGVVPKDVTELLTRVRQRGRNIGPWAQGELEELANRRDTVLVPVDRYEQWCRTRLTDRRRKDLEKYFGTPPGKLMVVRRKGRAFFVLPGIRLGNILLAPQPERGETQDDSLLHSRDVPPPHNYLAFYFWLQEEFRPDAIIHWGTHGTVELLPGKEAGLSGDDWSDLCVGSLPVINPWIMDNLGEATLSRRRSYAVLVDHLVPPAVPAGLTDELRLLHDNIDKFDTLETGILREEFRKRITAAVRSARIDETLQWDVSSRTLTDDEIASAAAYLHKVHNTITPTTLHILGQVPDASRLPSYLVSILGASFLDRIAEVFPVPEDEDRFEGDRHKWLRRRGKEIIQRAVFYGQAPPESLNQDIRFARIMLQRLQQADDEIENLLQALEGRYVQPGPGPDPIRNPASVPPGRNLYALNPEEIPTPASWEVAKQLVDEMLRSSHPRKVGIDLNGMNTMRDFGVMEGQILYLMGVRPVWDRNHLAVDVELIPREQLGRPRVDVFISMGGQYKENFPSRITLLDKAVRLVSQLDEQENLVRAGTEELYRRLVARGFSEERARAMAPARIFGTKPGNLSGTNILHLVPRSGVWENVEEITSVYISNMSYVYTGDIRGEKIDGLYEDAILHTDTILRVWASNMTSQLSNHHAYEYLGGLSLAVQKLTGREPRALIADVRDPRGARMRRFEEVLATTFRAELLNRKWIEGMIEHGYAGAGQMAELVKNTFGWDVTRTNSVSTALWNDIYQVYIEDRYAVGLKEWFHRVNPYALQEIAATMLEAARKQYWAATPETLEALSRLYAESVVQHGPSAGLVSGGNRQLRQFVEERLQAPGNEALNALRAKYAATMNKREQPVRETSGTTDYVEGKKMQPAPPPRSPARLRLILVGAIVLLLFVIGSWKRSGGPS